MTTDDTRHDPAAGTAADTPTPTPSEPATEPATDPAEDPAGADLERRLHRLTRLLRWATGGRRGRGRGPRGEGSGQGRVLALLALQSPIPQRDLGYLLGVQPQSLGELLGKLQAVGLIRRTPDPDDARARVVELTDAGRAAAQELSQRPTIDALAPLSDLERVQFLEMLDRIMAGLEESVGPDPRWERGGGFPGHGRGRGHGRRPFDGPEGDALRGGEFRRGRSRGRRGLRWEYEH